MMGGCVETKNGYEFFDHIIKVLYFKDRIEITDNSKGLVTFKIENVVNFNMQEG